MAYYVGDQYSLYFNEIVVAVPSADKPAERHNLHVSLAAIINPKKFSWSDEHDAARIVRRCTVRLCAVVVDDILKHGPLSAKDLHMVATSATAKAQETFDRVFKLWKKADKYQVEIVITSFFLTDVSVGRAPPRGFWW